MASLLRNPAGLSMRPSSLKSPSADGQRRISDSLFPEILRSAQNNREGPYTPSLLAHRLIQIQQHAREGRPASHSRGRGAGGQQWGQCRIPSQQIPRVQFAISKALGFFVQEPQQFYDFHSGGLSSQAAAEGIRKALTVGLATLHQGVRGQGAGRFEEERLVERSQRLQRRV